MIKRISILVRRPQDDREAFSKHWYGVHGPFVAQLPLIRGYIQNHVLDEFTPFASDTGTYDIDGFVELYFADVAAMRTAFTGPNAQPIWADEPNFLGHSTAYAINGDRQPNPEMTDAKLIVVASGDAAAIDSLEKHLGGLGAALAIERDDVMEVVPRKTMERGPQRANVFIHARYAGVDAASEAGRRLATLDLFRPASHGIERIAVTRVIEKRII